MRRYIVVFLIVVAQVSHASVSWVPDILTGPTVPDIRDVGPMPVDTFADIVASIESLDSEIFCQLIERPDIARLPLTYHEINETDYCF